MFNYLKAMFFWKCHNLVQNHPNFTSWGCFGIVMTSSWWWPQRFWKLMHPRLSNSRKNKWASLSIVYFCCMQHNNSIPPSFLTFVAASTKDFGSREIKLTITLTGVDILQTPKQRRHNGQQWRRCFCQQEEILFWCSHLAPAEEGSR